MAVRFKLDRAGIKLSLRQWSRFNREDRQALLIRRCETPEEVGAYRALLVRLVALRAGEAAKPLVEAPSDAWLDPGETPAAIVRRAAELGLAPPDSRQWARLTHLERFVLLKLSRDNHDNLNFGPAMREFGLAPSAAPAAPDDRFSVEPRRRDRPTPSR